MIISSEYQKATGVHLLLFLDFDLRLKDLIRMEEYPKCLSFLLRSGQERL